MIYVIILPIKYNDSLQIILLFEVYYIKYLFKEFKEIAEIFNNIFNMQYGRIEFTFKVFSDNTEKLIKNLILMFIIYHKL